MSLIHLIIESAFDIIVIMLGVTVAFRAIDNYPKFYWGMIAIFVGLFFLWENIGWLIKVNLNPVFEYTDILNIEKMLKWQVMAAPISLFPFASLRPGYLNHYRVIAFLLPPVIVTTVGICYLCFNGHITQIASLDQIALHIDKPDIKLRIAIFLCTVFMPLIYFIYPMINNRMYRKINRTMYLFIGFIVLLFVIYISFTLYINPVIFNGFGIFAIVFALMFSFQYLRYENPFSVHVRNNGDTGSLPTAPTLSLYGEIENYFSQNRPFIKADYCNEMLANMLGVDKSEISTAIKSGGYSSFKEYINHLRLEYFSYLQSQNPDRSVKELMFECGFTSRTTFYRLFAERYGVSPTKHSEDKQE